MCVRSQSAREERNSDYFFVNIFNIKVCISIFGGNEKMYYIFYLRYNSCHNIFIVYIIQSTKIF